jgi:hypothetical protein
MVHRKRKDCSENGTQIKVFNAYATKQSKIPLAKNHQRIKDITSSATISRLPL